MKEISIFCVLFLFTLGASSQTNDSIPQYLYLISEEGDTLPYYSFPEAPIVGFQLKNKRERKKYNRLKDKVIKVYPYAELAGEVMRNFSKEYAELESKKEKKKFAKEAEDKLKEKFEGDLRNMKVSEGVILIKLIDRQTGETSFELVKDLKSSVNAYMWQTVARLFGHNLKDSYDPGTDREDQMIEDIVDRIESGEFEVERKTTAIN